MFEWLSGYNYDFALASLPIQIMLIVYYCFQKNLPTRQSRIFLWLMLVNFIMTSADIVACELNEIWMSYPLPVMYLVNVVYFLAFILRGWLLFLYSAECSMAYEMFSKLARRLANIPVAFMVLLIVTTPFTGLLFSFREGVGYENTVMYRTIYISTWLYIILSLICIMLSSRYNTTVSRFSMYGYNLILIAGILLRGYFPNTLVTSYFSIMAILVIYMSSQSPYLFKDKRIGVFNRFAFATICSEYIRTDSPFSCMCFAVHDYETAKSVYGAEQLNRSLNAIGAWVEAKYPASYCCYFGNGSFVLLKKGNVESYQKMHEDIRDRFSQSWKGLELDVSMNVCTVYLSAEAPKRNTEFVIDCILRAMKEAEIRYENRCYLIEKSLVDMIDREMAVSRAVGQALRDHSFQVYFQPICNVQTGAVEGAEALARLHDDELGFIPPQEFIAVAEKNGSIMELGRQIFERVCQTIHVYDFLSPGIKFINVNLSPAQCMNEQLAGDLIEIAEAYHVDMSRLNLEITEAAAEDMKAIAGQMETLKSHGIRFSLDDFGAGTSNITRFMDLPLDNVKLDMKVVWAWFNGENHLLPHLIRMFQEENLVTVAEGIETAEMADRIRELGCNYVQGYYYSKPIPVEEFMHFLDEYDSEPA